LIKNGDESHDDDDDDDNDWNELCLNRYDIRANGFIT